MKFADLKKSPKIFPKAEVVTQWEGALAQHIQDPGFDPQGYKTLKTFLSVE